MSGYASNPNEHSVPGAASLTASLLARKGEAAPAVDADAHAGVDIDLHYARQHPQRERAMPQRTVESLYPGGAAENRPRGEVRAFRQRVRAAAHHHAAGQQSARTEAGPGRKATITFRMPAKDFVRLRFASKELQMSCQSILLDALDTYLDANDVAPISDADCESEIERLSRTMRRARAAR